MLGSRPCAPVLGLFLAAWPLCGYPAGMTDPQPDAPELVRHDGRALDELRPGFFVRDFTEFAAGSVLAVSGRTKVLCTASVDEDVPRWMRGTRRGWVTAEYSLLPGSSPERVSREATRGRQSGRTQEIQRLIGRALRSIIDLEALGERQILIDCDVLQADGGREQPPYRARTLHFTTPAHVSALRE